MASHLVCTTPPPPGSVCTPNTPRLGFEDSWEPFSPRKSARISSQKSANRTPSPRSASVSIPKSSRASRQQSSYDILSTPMASPHKKRQPAMDSVRRARPGHISAAGSSRTADAGIGSHGQNKPSAPTSMLPTPSKTPRKHDQKTQAKVHSVARNLFAPDTDTFTMPRSKKAKKYTGLTLDSFNAEDVDDPIAIFTDSRDRVPELDASSQNPFYQETSKVSTSEPAKRRSPRNLVKIPGEGRQSVEEAIKREDGIVYVFRGKKIFKKFDEIDGESDGSLCADDLGVVGDSDAEVEESPRMIRSIKPRRLFQADEKPSATPIDDEEVLTEIEEGADDTEVEEPETPATPHKGKGKGKVDTPKAPRHAPCSPPSTSRTARFTDKVRSDIPPAKRPSKAQSPFDGWRRSKRGAEPPSRKREAETFSNLGESHKRQRI